MFMLMAVVGWLVTRTRAAWFEGEWGWFSDSVPDVWGKIKHIVHALINVLMDWVSSAFDNVWSFADSIYHTVEDGLSYAVNLVWQLYSEAQNFAVSLIRDAINTAWDWVAGIWNWISSVGNWLVDVANSVETWIWNAVQDGVAYVATHVWGWIESGVNFAVHELGKAVDALFSTVREFVCGLVDLVNLVVGTISGVVAWVLNTGEMVARVVLKALGWLEYFATHPFDWFAHLFADFAEKAPRYILAHLTDAIAKEGSVIEDYMAKWLEL